MSIIRLHAAQYPADYDADLDFGDEAYSDHLDRTVRRYAGSFDTDAAMYWEHSGSSTARVWLTPSGRWVKTTPPTSHDTRGWRSYITVDQARAWLAEHGHTDAIREHIDVERDELGRPPIGPEVKFRVPAAVRDAIDAMASRNGLTRAEQLRAIVMDTVPLA